MGVKDIETERFMLHTANSHKLCFFPLQVETTNDSSTISKLSACNAGYIVDEHLKYFVERPTRRAPLIHR